MTHRLDHPDMPVQLRSLQAAVEWAAGCEVFWQDTNEGGVIRRAGTVWGELRLRNVAPVGVDERSYVESIDPNWPLQEARIGIRQWNVQLTMRSRKQNFDDASVAWYAAVKAQLRLRYDYVRSTWLLPAKLSLISPGTVLNMPSEREFDDRNEDFAVLDMVFSALISDTDEAAVVSWIEKIKLSTKIQNPAEQALDASLQLNDEVIP